MALLGSKYALWQHSPQSLASIANRMIPEMFSCHVPQIIYPCNSTASSCRQRCLFSCAFPGKKQPPVTFDDQPPKRKKQQYFKNQKPYSKKTDPSGAGQKQRLAKASISRRSCPHLSRLQCSPDLRCGRHGFSVATSPQVQIP